MAVSKRLRFEILRRDGFACRYCGAIAPAVRLVVDHVTPKALGGTDDPSNLVAACFDCNAGKSSATPDQPLVADVDADAMAWATSVRQELQAMLEQEQRTDAVISAFAQHWNAHQGGKPDDGWWESIRTFLAAGLTLDMLQHAATRAIHNPRVHPHAHWRYFCGTCWSTVREAQQRAGGHR